MVWFYEFLYIVYLNYEKVMLWLYFLRLLKCNVGVLREMYCGYNVSKIEDGEIE